MENKGVQLPTMSNLLIRELIPYKSISHLSAFFLVYRNLNVNPTFRKRFPIYFLMFLQGVNSLRFAYLTLDTNLTPIQRIAMFDLSYLIHLSPRLNLLVALALPILTYGMWIEWFVYDPKLMGVFHGIVIQRNGSFFTTYGRFCSGRSQVICFTVCKRVRWILAACQLAVVIIHALTLYLHYVLVENIYLNWENYFGRQDVSLWPLVTILKLAWIEYNCLLNTVTLNVLAHVLIFIVVYFASFTMIFFAKLDQIADAFKIRLRVSRARLVKLINQHVEVVQLILLFNNLYSFTMVGYLAVNLPLNLLLTGSFMANHNFFTRMPPIILLCIAIFLLQQLIGVFGCHLICALYSRKIHREIPKRLLYLDTRFNLGSLRVALKVAQHIEKFHTRKLYGFTYGKFGLITLTGFVKYLFLYAKFLMMTYKLLTKDG